MMNGTKKKDGTTEESDWSYFEWKKKLKDANERGEVFSVPDPCPECGSQPLIVKRYGNHDARSYIVICSDKIRCGFISAFKSNTEKNAIKAWNSLPRKI